MALRTQARSAAAAGVALIGALAAGAPAEAITSGHIRGTVTVPRGLGTSGLEVETYQLVSGAWRNVDRITDVRSTGAFDVAHLTTGTYRLRVSDPRGTVLGEYYDDARSFDAATTIRVRAGHAARLRTIHLAKAAHVRGRVRDSSGRPVRTVSVEAYVRSGSTWRFERNEYPDRDGVYDIGGLRPGSYRIAFRSDDRRYVDTYWPRAGSIETARTIAVRAGEVVSGRSATVVTGARIRGTVMTDEGRSVADGTVTPYVLVDGTWTPRWDLQAPTDGDGRYEIRGLGAGSYRIRFWTLDGDLAEEFWDDSPVVTRATDIVVPTATVLSGKDAVLTHVAYVAGKVRSTDQTSLSGITVTAYRPVPGGQDEWEPAGTAVTSAAASGSPDYQMRLAPGTYRFTYEDPAGRWATTTVEDVVIVRSGNAPYLRVTLRPVVD